MLSMSEQTPEERLEALEADAFRSGRTLAELRTEIGHIFAETRGLASWTARQEEKSDARHAEYIQRMATVAESVEFVEGKVDLLTQNIDKIMRHLGISETEE
jgi:hypothetical protein